MRQVAEVFAGDGEQLGLAEAAIIQPFDADDARQQVGAMPFEVPQQHLTQIALAVAMAEQQDDVGIGQGRCDRRQIGMVEGGPLTGLVAVVAVGESLAAPPDAMGMQHGMLHLLPLQPKDVSVVMVQMDDKTQALIAARSRGLRLGMIGRHPDLLEEMAQAQDRLGIQVGLMAGTADADPGLRPVRHADAQPMVAELGHLSPEGTAERFDPGGADAVAQGVGEHRAQRDEMRMFHRSFAVLRQAYRGWAAAPLTPP